MKKFLMFLASGIFALSLSCAVAFAQEEANEAAPEAAVEQTEAAAPTDVTSEDSAEQEVALHQQLKTKFIEGGAGFMALVIICLILGLAIAIERILYLAFCGTNTKVLLLKVEAALKEGGVEAAKTVCRETKGPVAYIFYQGLVRADQGIDNVEKSIVAYGSVKMSEMEKGLSWIGLFIAIAPSLGFLGTVIGMIQAFDAIQKAGDISPNVVAGGMKVALITTVGGLIVALILQLFYNLILARIDTLSIQMEDASIAMVDLLKENNKK